MTRARPLTAAFATGTLDLMSASRATARLLARARDADGADRRPAADHPVWAAAAGDERAAERLLTLLMPRVRNLVRFLVWRDADVDDITQEALLVVLDGLASYRGEGALEAWVDRVVVRATFRHRRRLRRDPSVDAPAPLEELVETASAGRPDDEYLARRRAVAILDRLSPEQRDAVVLHHVLGMTVPEVCEQLGIPAETVRSRLRLARTRLREHGLDTGDSVDGGDA